MPGPVLAMLYHSFLCDSEAEPCVLSQTGIVGPQLMQRNPYAYWDLDPLSCLGRALEGGSQVNGLGAINPEPVPRQIMQPTSDLHTVTLQTPRVY